VAHWNRINVLRDDVVAVNERPAAVDRQDPARWDPGPADEIVYVRLSEHHRAFVTQKGAVRWRRYTKDNAAVGVQDLDVIERIEMPPVNRLTDSDPGLAAESGVNDRQNRVAGERMDELF
jgi:hypothetical protein